MAEAEQWRKHARWAGRMAAEAAERAGVITGADPQSQDQGTQTDSTKSPPDHWLFQGTHHERERLWWAGFEAAREK
eukprot:13199767-Heterocapsa_arctica.AAC.1